MENVIFEVKTYMTSWRQSELREFDGLQIKVRAVVRCTGTDTKSNSAYMMDVLFLAPDSQFPPPSFNTAKNQGFMFMPISDIGPFLDMLRYEKPIYGYIYPDKPDFTTIGTGNEPVGEQESEG